MKCRVVLLADSGRAIPEKWVLLDDRMMTEDQAALLATFIRETSPPKDIYAASVSFYLRCMCLSLMRELKHAVAMLPSAQLTAKVQKEPFHDET